MKYLVFVVLFLAVFLQISTAAVIPQLSQEEESCVTEQGLDRGTILAIHLQTIKDEDNKVYNNYLACCYKKKGFMDDKGNVLFEVLKLKLNHNKTPDARTDKALEVIVGSCRTLRGDYDGHTAVKVHNCMGGNLMKAKVL